MSSLATIAHLRRATSQLPVSWYCDPAIYAAEQRLLFPRAPSYVGHELMVPNVGDYCALESRDNAQALVRNAAGHRARLEHLPPPAGDHAARVAATARNIVCPIHRWTYDLKGELLGAPHFADNPCLHLRPLAAARTGTGSCSTASATSIATSRRSRVQTFDFSNHVLDRIEINECNYNWKTFIEVYLEDYHVEPFHPGLGQFVTCDDLKWEFGDWYSVQTVGVRNKPREARDRRTTRGGTRRSSTITAARRRRTARSGWSTTRTSCSSGIRTCSSSAR